MSVFVDCIEPHTRPARRTVEVVAGQELAVYLLAGEHDARSRLRHTVLRLADEQPPAGAQLIMWLRCDGVGLSVVEVARGLTVEMIRSGLRSHAISGIRLPTTTPFEITLPNRFQVSLTLTVRQPLAQGAAHGVAGGGTRKSRVMYRATNVWWLITDSKGIIVTFGIKLRDAVVDRLMKMGIDSRVITFTSGLILAGLIMGFVAWRQHSNAVDATDRAEGAEEAASLAQAARQASLATELACLEERAKLAEQLGEAAAQQGLAAEVALELDRSRSLSLELGGMKMGGADLADYDRMFVDGLVAAVVSSRGSATGDPEPCLELDAALGADLPRYLLLWHPDTLLTCPADYAGVEGGVEHVGRWGLSSRVSVEFGHGGDLGTGSQAASIGEIVGDPRMEDRWAAFTAAAAYREILAALLEIEIGQRPPVMPSQAQLWALALLDAYNRLPSPAGGVLDGTAASCVEEVVRGHLAAAPPAVKGEPILPDIVTVAVEDEGVIIAQPTPACPWPKGALQLGARSAIQSVSRAVAHADAS